MAGDGGVRVGFYICHCGLNIAGKVDVAAVRDFAAGLHGVSVSRDYRFMCSDPGQDLIRQDIASGLVDRVVVASCSPLMHEGTFRRALESAGLNPYFFQMCNIREQVSWVTEDPVSATRKAKALAAAAVRRVAEHEPLERRTVPVHPDVLVVGGGIAGIHAALTLAEAGKKVHLVERDSSIGGHMAQFDKTFPTLDCAACILTPKMVSVKNDPNIHLMTWAEVKSATGYVGSFHVTVEKKPRYVDETLCTRCGACWNHCPALRVPSRRRIVLAGRPVNRA